MIFASRKRKLIITLVVVLVSVFVIYNLPFFTTRNPEVILRGELLANDCGEPIGGFEWVGLYNVTIENNVMKLNLSSGLGDYLRSHEYPCIIIRIAKNSHIVLKICSPNSSKCEVINLTYHTEDPVWGIKDVYIGYYLDPTIFDGFKEWFYVELRIYEITQ